MCFVQLLQKKVLPPYKVVFKYLKEVNISKFEYFACIFVGVGVGFVK